MCTSAQGTEDKRSILVIHSWHDILWDRLWEKGLDDKLGETYQLIHFDLDAMRSTPEALQQNADIAWSLYKNLKPSLVILGDDEALRVMGNRFAEKLPVVYLGINNNPRKLVTDILPRNFTGVIERPLYERALRHIVEILPPGTEKVLFLNDVELAESSVTDIGNIFQSKTSTQVGEITFELEVTNNWDAWKKAVTEAESKGYGAILFDSRYLIFDSEGRYVEPEPGVVRWMADNSRLPTFNFYEDAIGPRLSVGGWVLSGYGMGSYAADIVLKILEEGKQPKDIYPVYYSNGEYIFSRTQLRHWGLTLPDEIAKYAKYAEDLYQLYYYDCSEYPNSVCFD
ncbi:ABC transporter substrate binding protein [Vibrio hannami]|uniref:ABC transporter substrate-binding protein n=1 Tax=Vibrio hannami TaxID=2717094 RepID=UPI00240FC618|nr:ABC transporter substrate binding protein [Vibrio hannami]MDG3085641.1 ABC transporter substrate binding protein [Vibrio hannami]